MGTKVQCKSYLPGYHSMRDLNEDSNSCSWPLYYGDKTFANGQYYNGFLPRAIPDVYSGYDKDVVKRTMLEHEAIFQNQVSELHRLYGIQRQLMDEVKRKELHKNRIPLEASLSSSALASQITSEDARRWHITSFPLANSVCARPSVSIVEDSHSPISSVKGSSSQATPFPSQNGVSRKDIEILESRPAKVRRRMIDLQLPADEYIDTDEMEQFRDDIVSGTSSYLPNGNLNMAPQSSEKLFLDDGEKGTHQGDVMRSGSRSTNGLADLNEPFQVEETNASAFAYPLGSPSSHEEIQGHEPSSRSKNQVLDLPEEILPNYNNGSNNGGMNKMHLDNGTGRGWFSHVLAAGHDKNGQKSVSQGLQLDKLPMSSQPVQILFNNAREPPAFPVTDQSKKDLWKERAYRGLETTTRNRENSHNFHVESGGTSSMPNTYPISPPDLPRSWNHLVSSWENPSCLGERLVSAQTDSFLNSSGTKSNSCQTSAPSQRILGDGWHPNNNSRANPIYGIDLPNRNGFHHGSSFGLKESSVHFSTISHDYLNGGKDKNMASEYFKTNGSGKVYQGSSGMEMKSVKDMNLNVALSDSPFEEAIPHRDLENRDGRKIHADHVTVLPWLRAKPSCKNETTGVQRDLNMEPSSFSNSSLNQLALKNDTGKGLNHISSQNSKSVTCSSNVGVNIIEISDCPSDRKILGFPIFEKPNISKNEPSSVTSLAATQTGSIPNPYEGKENKGKIRVLDINLPCDPGVPDIGQDRVEKVLIIEKGTDKKVTRSRHDIDLNLCVNEDEASSSMPSSPRTTGKLVSGIDLEAPVVLDTLEDVCGNNQPDVTCEEPLKPQHEDGNSLDELMRIAGEAIVAISSGHKSDDVTCVSSEACAVDPLIWFAEIINSCGDDIERNILQSKNSGDNEESSSEEIDFFESMTLQLPEMKEEDYMPKPLVPENLKFEETAATLIPNRPRKGHARRGRQRRDFQRDILPGLASLSRHEVTEDLQTFGGLMRATGHSWNAGLTRRNTRNGCTRGRRRSVNSASHTVAGNTGCTPLVQQLNNIEVGLEDRSLTGWGKTTRRPRRQRCPAGNPPSVALT